MCIVVVVVVMVGCVVVVVVVSRMRACVRGGVSLRPSPSHESVPTVLPPAAATACVSVPAVS